MSMRTKVILRKPIRRLLSVNPGTPGYQKQVNERYRMRLITDHPQYKEIIRALSEGVSPTAISRHFADNQLIDVHERVFYQALLDFRRSNPDALRPGTDDTGLDQMISPKLPPLDIKSTAHQLLRLQKDRLAITHAFEKSTNMPVQNMHKELEVSVKLIETIANMEGRGGKNGAKGLENAGFAPDVAENLDKLRRETSGGNALHNLTRQLVKSHDDANPDNPSTQKVRHSS